MIRSYTFVGGELLEVQIRPLDELDYSEEHIKMVKQAYEENKKINKKYGGPEGVIRELHRLYSGGDK